MEETVPEKRPPTRLDYARPSSNVRQREDPLIKAFVLLFMLVLIMSIFLPPGGRGRPQAFMVKCGSNLRQIGQAIELYANDHIREMALMVVGVELNCLTDLAEV